MSDEIEPELEDLGPRIEAAIGNDKEELQNT